MPAKIVDSFAWPDPSITRTLMMLACGAVLAFFAWDERRVGRYALGIAAAAFGVGGWAIHLIDLVDGGEKAYLATAVLLAGAVIFILIRAQRALRGPA